MTNETHALVCALAEVIAEIESHEWLTALALAEAFISDTE